MLSALTSGIQSLMVTRSKSGELSARVAQRLEEAFNEKTNAATKSYEEKASHIDFESERWIDVKAGIFTATNAFDNAADNLETIRTNLLELGAGISKAESDVDLGRERHDAGWQKIRDAADSYSAANNPIGRVDRTTWAPNTITYKESPGAGEVSLTGTFAGTDFRITTADGTTWRPDDGFVLQEYDSAGTKGDGLASMKNAVTLTSYDEASGAITIEINHGDSVETVTGTLEQGGSKVMPSWFYGGFATAEGRSAAREDMKSALSKFQVDKAVVVGGQERVKQSARKADEALDALTKEKSSALREQMEENLTREMELRQQMQIIAMNISGQESQQGLYAQVFGSTIARSKFLQIDS